MRKVTTIIVTIMMAVAATSYGFEVGGFKDGMSKEIVLEKVISWNFDKIIENDGGLSMYDLPEKNTFRHYNLLFKNNKLVGLQINFKPSMANYILLFEELGVKYGEKVSCNAESRLSTDGEHKNITCIWFNGREKINISYNVFTSNDQLSVYYDADDKYNTKGK